MNQQVRIKILAGIFLVVTGWAVFKLSSSGTSSAEFARISIDTTGITQILIQGDSVQTSLKKDGAWMINNKYKIRPEFQQLLFTAFSRMEIKRPVAKENEKSVLELVRTKGFLISTNGQPQFRVAANENDVNSSYYVKEGEQSPYIIYVPGFKSSMTELLKQKEEVWRNRILLTCSPLSLQTIKLEFPSIPSSNFEIKYVRPQEFEFVGATQLDTAKMIGFLEQFQEVRVAQYIVENSAELISKLSKEKPVCILTVRDINPESSQTLLIYGPSKVNNGIYCILKERNELITLSPNTVERILARREFFIPKK